MPLLPGTCLGPYEILARVGAGGMGEVYRARDTRLDRIVAVKVCQERFSERFQREARAIAALNHPHICQLYDVGPDYLVMEYVEGKPVSGPLPLSQALPLAVEIACALDAAHSKGLVHRDLKPDNILVSKSAGIKLLDFGLAKAAARNSAAAPDETVTRALTQEGAIVGTLQYMSPEQLQGAEVDSRSDIYSFGVVLYEMLTGRRAFDGANRASIIAAILTAQPPPVSAHDPLSPHAVDRVLSRCLAKDPEARWQSARDLAASLEYLSEPALPATTVPRSGIRARSFWMIALLLAVVAGLGAYVLRSPHETPRVFRFTVAAQGVQFGSPVISPDGSRVAFISGDTRSSQLWIRSLSAFEAQRIEGAENASEPIWSPDGAQIAVGIHGTVYQYDLNGRHPRRVICDLARSIDITGSWNSSGIIILSQEDGIYRVSASGGELVQVTRVNRSRGELYHLMPYFLPDNRHFLYLTVNQRAAESAIYEGSLDSLQVQRVIPSLVGPVYFIGSELIFVRGSTLMAQKFDWKTGKVTGEPTSLQEHVYANPSSYSPFASFSASSTTLAYYPDALPAKELVWLDRRGNRISSIGAVAHYTNPALSPDQKQVAVGITDPRTNQRDVWLIDALGGSTRVTADPKDDFNPTWSPDGTRIAFVSDRKGVRDLFVKPATGIGVEELILASADQKAAEGWSPDGKYLIYGNLGRIRAVAMQGEHTSLPVVDGPGYCDQSSISPDGRWIAYRSHDAGRVEVFIQGFGSGVTHWQVSTDGGGEPSWRRDGKELYFVRDKQLFAVDINATSSGIEHGAPKLLFSAPLTLEIKRNRYVPAADGQRFLIVAQAEQRGLEAHVVVNWRAALKMQ